MRIGQLDMVRWVVAIAALLTLLMYLTGCAQPSSPSSAPADLGFNTQVQPTWVYAPGIDRKEFEYIYALGGGVDADGYFRTPIPAEQVFSDRPTTNGIFATPMRWDPQNAILYEVQNGFVIRQDFQINP